MPVISTFEVTKETKGLMLASDGLWDELNKNEISIVFSEYFG